MSGLDLIVGGDVGHTNVLDFAEYSSLCFELNSFVPYFLSLFLFFLIS